MTCASRASRGDIRHCRRCSLEIRISSFEKEVLEIRAGWKTEIQKIAFLDGVRQKEKEREEELEEMEEEEAKHYRDWVFVNGKYYYRDVNEEEQQQQQEEEQQEELSQKAQKKEESRQDQEEEEEDQDQDLDSDSLAETVAASEPEALGRQPY
jgi:hypothetical protein